MKKVIMILMTAAAMTAMSCGDGNGSNESANDTDTGGDNTELAEPDTTSMERDTTSMNNTNQRQNNDMDNDDSGSAQSGDQSGSRNQRDSIR